MRNLARRKGAIAIICILTIAFAGASIAGTTEIDPGDPLNIPPGCQTPEPAPVILNVAVSMLAAVVSILLT